MLSERQVFDPDDDVRLLAERDGVLAVYKPARLATEPTGESTACLLSELSRLLGARPLRAASRLDVGVSGVVLCTVGRPAAQRLARLRQSGAVVRTYVGIAAGRLPRDGSWCWSLRRQRMRSGRARARADGAGSLSARTDFRVLATSPEPSPHGLLVLRPHTGRFHQLRAHAAQAGAPLLGDRRYGGASTVVGPDGQVHALGRVALHAASVRLGGWLQAEAPIPAALEQAWRLLGGSPEPWLSLPRHYGPW